MIKTNTYDKYAEQFAKLREEDIRSGVTLDGQLITPKLLAFAGELDGTCVLDAGCGEGFLSREMRKRGAKVIGIDISPKLIQYARTRSEGFDIEYMVHDLSKPLPEELRAKFDLVVTNMVIDDVPDHLGFISNLDWLTKPNGRVVLSKNNPYSAVIRGKVEDYFESGKAILYKGLSSRGVKVYYFHRTLEEYITKFSRAGFYLSRLSDLKPGEDLINTTTLKDSDRYRKYYHFPFLMVIEFKKVN